MFSHPELADCSDIERYFTCENKGCIPQDYVCDGVHDCGHGDDSDERDCKGLTVSIYCLLFLGIYLQ